MVIAGATTIALTPLALVTKTSYLRQIRQKYRMLGEGAEDKKISRYAARGVLRPYNSIRDSCEKKK